MNKIPFFFIGEPLVIFTNSWRLRHRRGANWYLTEGRGLRCNGAFFAALIFMPLNRISGFWGKSFRRDIPLHPCALFAIGNHCAGIETLAVVVDDEICLCGRAS